MAIYYTDVEGFAHKEIAAIMDTRSGTVMSRLLRGRRQRRTLLAAPHATAAQPLLFTDLTMASSMSGRFKNGAMMSTGSGNTTVEL